MVHLSQLLSRDLGDAVRRHRGAACLQASETARRAVDRGGGRDHDPLKRCRPGGFEHPLRSVEVEVRVEAEAVPARPDTRLRRKMEDDRGIVKDWSEIQFEEICLDEGAVWVPGASPDSAA